MRGRFDAWESKEAEKFPQGFCKDARKAQGGDGRSLAVEATVPRSMELGVGVKVITSFLESINPKLAVAAEKCRYVHSGFR